MHANTEHFVIAVTGASGAGKTTLVGGLVQELGDATALYFDDYHPGRVDSSSYPKDLAQWLADGADPADWDTPQMVADLQALMRGETIAHPYNQTSIPSATFIVLEEPFGRTRATLKDLIDHVIAIDIPLEVALARRLLRTANNPHFKEHPEEFGPSIVDYLNLYLEVARPLYIAVNQYVYQDYDLMLDGLKPLAELVDEAARQVRIVAGSIL